MRPGSLLRRHVRRRAEQQAGRAERRTVEVVALSRSRLQRPRYAEIRHEGIPVTVQQNVFRLDVAMDDAMAMRVRQCAGDIAEYPQRVTERQRLRGDPGAEALAVHERHGVVEQPCRDTGIVQWKDVRMAQLRGDPDLALEPTSIPGSGVQGGDVRMDDLQGDRAAVTLLTCQVDGGHAAPAELALDAVAAGQRVPQGCREIRCALVIRRDGRQKLDHRRLQKAA